MNLRHLRYFVILAREGHFGRAARASNVTQPTLSAAIRQLETEFRAPLVYRSRQSFERLTQEGLKVLAWAQETLAGQSALEDALAEHKGELSGQLRLGVIPTAEPLIALVSAAVLDRYPGMTITALSHTHADIERGLAEHTFEAGISYLESITLADLQSIPLYAERYVVVGAGKLLRRHRNGISWRDAAELPLCLLSQDMTNRKLVNGLFAAAGTLPTRVVESNTLVGVLSHVLSQRWCSVLPDAMLPFIEGARGLMALALHTPEVSYRVGLIYPQRTPLPPLTRALTEIARSLRFEKG